MIDSRHSFKDSGLLVQGDPWDCLEALKNAPIGIFTSTPEGRLLSVNPAMARMFEYETPQKMLGAISDIASQLFVDPADRKKIRHFLKEEDEVFSCQCPLRRLDGTVIWGVMHVQLMSDKDGKSRYQGFISGITEHKQADADLLQQNAHFESFFTNTNDAVVLFDTEHRIVNVNDMFTKIFGYTLDEVRGENINTVVDPHNHLHEYASPRILQGEQVEMESFRYTKKGELRHVLLKGGPIRDKDKIVGGYANYADITGRKQAEEALRESWAKMQAITDSAQDAIIMMAPEGDITYWNPMAEKIFQYTAEEAMGKNLHYLLAPERYHQDITRAMSKFQRTGQGNAVGKTIELAAIGKDGKEIPISLSMSSVLLQGKWHAVGIIRDISYQKMAEDALIRAKEQAEAASYAKSEFLANMSHEIRTPINGIMGMMQLLLTTSLDEEQQEYVETGLNSANRLTRLLSDILDLSRIEAGQMEIRKEEVSIKKLCESVDDLFMVTSRDKNVSLEYSLDPELPSVILGDESRLQQILFNLVGNALKFTENGQVSVSWHVQHKKGDNIRMLISVSDSGIGMSEDKVDDLFKPFVQAENAYTRKYQGAGLGLSIVTRLVKLMHGNMSVESTPGEGSTFYVSLPLGLPEQSESDQLQSTFKADTGKGRLRILPAEDDPSNQLPMKLLLEKSGHVVSLAEDGQQALDILADQNFDCIIMDIHMPVMDGVEATRRIRSMEHRAWSMGYGAEDKGQRAEDRNQKSDIRNQRTEDRGQGTEDGDQTSEMGERTPEFLNFLIPQSPNSEAPESSPELNTPEGTPVQPGKNPRIPIIALTAYAMDGDQERFLDAGMDDYLAKPVQKEDLERTLRKHCR